MSRWRLLNNGTGETYDLFEGDEMLGEVTPRFAKKVVVRHNAALAALARVTRERDELLYWGYPRLTRDAEGQGS